MSYVSLQKRQLLDSLENQALYADLCSLVIGELGIGKSFLLQQLGSRLQSQLNISLIESQAEMSPQQLQQSILLQLGLSWDPELSLLDKLKGHCDNRVLLCIDDSHLLPMTCLEYLMTLVEEQLKTGQIDIFILLSGNSGLAEKLNHTSVLSRNPNLCVVFEINPIEAQETKHLVAELQSIDASDCEALFGQQKLDYFWQLSRGLPGELKYQLERWGRETTLNESNKDESQIRRKYVLTGVYSVIAVVLLLVLYYQQSINDYVAQGNDSESTAEKVVLASEKQHKAITETPNEILDEQSALPDEASASNESASNESAPIAEDTSIRETEAQTEKPQKENIVGNVLEAALQVKTSEEAQDEISDKPVSAEKPPAKITTQTPTPAKTHQLKPTAADTKAELKGIDKDEARLLATKDNQYTLQWLAVSNYQAAVSFRNEHPLKNQMLIYRRQQGDKLLYLVVSNEFNNKNDAEHSRIIYQRRGYPGKPWIKTLAAVKKDILSRP